MCCPVLMQKLTGPFLFRNKICIAQSSWASELQVCFVNIGDLHFYYRPETWIYFYNPQTKLNFEKAMSFWGAHLLFCYISGHLSLRHLNITVVQHVNSLTLRDEFMLHNPANAKLPSHSWGWVPDLTHLLQSWRLQALLTVQLLLGLWVIAIDTTLIVSDDPPHEVWVKCGSSLLTWILVGCCLCSGVRDS